MERLLVLDGDWDAREFGCGELAATTDLMLEYMDFFLGGDEKRIDLPPLLHQKFPLCLPFGAFQAIGTIKKLNDHNYSSWQTLMQSYLEGQELWELIGGNETAPLASTGTHEATLRKWKSRAGKALYVIKASVEENILKQIKNAKTPKEAWDILAFRYSKKNEMRLQYLENELMGIKQGGMPINQYFTKKRSVEGNVATSTDHEEGVNSEEEWDAQASVAISERIDKEEEEIDFDQRDLEDLNSSHKIAEDNTIKQALAATFPEEVNYSIDWIVDFGCSNHMTSDKEKVKSMSEYKGDRVVVTTNNSRLAIAHIGKAMIAP
ncbi:hypothetical protein RJ639_038875 [Escallonia herrerae]|uniref:Retrovirus-related Pol polyprotein from transposon TNT 1-94-like beta-barrel domain-containing protein n=1 Tax=Escallonia herrerae TaxID=1293975 RepID=A0AA88WLL9_9ASTE|nr:hypothetical protein RJ639_038875 [Escallonia herrerae]